MPARLARIILAFTTFPLIGAFGLRWVGGFVREVVASTGLHPPAILLLDYAGSIAGIVLGVILAIQLVGCCMQPESLPVRPIGDNILIVLALTFLLDVALGKVCQGAEWLKWLPPANLVIWSGAAAATASAHRMRQDWRAHHRAAPVPADEAVQAAYQPPSPGPGR
jgi:hypothetical protein